MATGLHLLHHWRKIVMLAITVATLGYFGLALYKQWETVSAWRPNALQLASLCGFALLMGLACFLLAENWHRLVCSVSKTAVPRAVTYPSFTTTQLGKYLPSNALHFVGRHLWLTRWGLRHRDLAAATLIEAILQILAASGVVAITLLFITQPHTDPLLQEITLFAPFFLGVMALLPLSWGVSVMWPSLASFRVLLGTSLWVNMGAGLFFACQGGIFLAICHMVTPDPGGAVIAIAIIAWIIGYVIPGAPGGLGVREAVLLLMLSPIMPSGPAVLAIALARLVSILGDLICFVLGQIIVKMRIFDLNPST